MAYTRRAPHWYTLAGTVCIGLGIYLVNRPGRVDEQEIHSRSGAVRYGIKGKNLMNFDLAGHGDGFAWPAFAVMNKGFLA